MAIEKATNDKRTYDLSGPAGTLILLYLLIEPKTHLTGDSKTASVLHSKHAKCIRREWLSLNSPSSRSLALPLPKEIRL
ncbi:MAG: hypothetical protein CO095_06180 [Armatimonadetes bacterium CG_4_9_14_3_um_filter_58_7]|nr:MAG: hypothetical protein CO095_06180 [Armatimonadetes bacterium CG_4_9_14_3_um_filter_58_7]